MRVECEALVNFVRLYDAVKDLVGSEYLDDCTYDWMIDGGEINKIVDLIALNWNLIDNIKEKLITSGYRRYLNNRG